MNHYDHFRQTLDEAVRSFSKRPSMHPHKGAKTVAGPARHDPLPATGGMVRGRIWAGMRKYGFVDISVPDMRNRSAMRDRYERAIVNALTTAWRC